jgi:Holliday junction resolvasome RuvABC endonuclease subunit
MNIPIQEVKRILAIDPTCKGLGFAVLEGPTVLIDWGVKHATSDRNAKCLRLARELVDRYQPEVLVVENTGAKGSRRCPRVIQLIENFLVLASSCGVRTRQISRQRVQRSFSKTGSATKRQVAVALSARFAELSPHLPPERRPWMSEDERMSIFDAVAFAWTFFEPFRRERRARALLDETASASHA